MERAFTQVDVFTTTLGPDHPNVAICLENYADVLRKLAVRSRTEAIVRMSALDLLRSK